MPADWSAAIFLAIAIARDLASSSALAIAMPVAVADADAAAIELASAEAEALAFAEAVATAETLASVAAAALETARSREAWNSLNKDSSWVVFLDSSFHSSKDALRISFWVCVILSKASHLLLVSFKVSLVTVTVVLEVAAFALAVSVSAAAL